MSSEQQTVPPAIQENGVETLLRRLQELTLEDFNTTKWKSDSAGLLPAILVMVIRKITRDLSDGPECIRFIRTLDYLQPNARQFQDFVRFVMTTNLNQATLTRISVSKNVTFKLFSRLGIRKTQYQVEEVLRLMKDLSFTTLHDCTKISAGEIKRLNEELALHQKNYPMSCERIAEERVRKYHDLLFRRNYVGASLAAIPLASTPNDIYGVAEVESKVDGIIHKTYLTGNIDIGLGIVATRSAKDLPTNKMPRHLIDEVNDISGGAYDILMNSKENGSYGHFVNASLGDFEETANISLEMLLIEVKRPREAPKTRKLTSVVHRSSHLHQILSMCCGVGYYNPQRRRGTVKFLLTDSVGFIWGVFDHRTFEAHYTEVLISNLRKRTADVMEFFRVWPIVPGELLVEQLLNPESRCEGSEQQVEDENEDLDDNADKQDDDVDEVDN